MSSRHSADAADELFREMKRQIVEKLRRGDYGIRAMAKLLLAYQDYHGLRTIEGIIGRWAPATENDTSSYADTVSRIMGVDINAVLDLHQIVPLTNLVSAMIRFECAGYQYPVSVLSGGVMMAVPAVV